MTGTTADDAVDAVTPDGGADSEPGTPEGRRVVQLLWDPPQPATRGPRPKVTLGQVLDTAMEVADAAGYDGLSMRSLAKQLGIGAMSLYTYVPGKTELFELMIDRAYAERSRPDHTWPWRQRYEHHASEALAMYRRHPWLVDSNLWRLPVGPGILDVSEDLLAIGRDAGLSLAVGSRVSQLLESYVYGIARGEVVDETQATRTGESVDDYWDARSSFWTTYFDPRRYPTMFATWESGAYDEGDPAADLQFALGLILDSVERLIGD